MPKYALRLPHYAYAPFAMTIGEAVFRVIPSGRNEVTVVERIFRYGTTKERVRYSGAVSLY